MFNFGSKKERKPSAVQPDRPSSPKPGLSVLDHERIRALGFFCGALTRGWELYADAGAGAAEFSRSARLDGKRECRREIHAVFAQACLDGEAVAHVREIDVFLAHTALSDADLTSELTGALRVALAKEKRVNGSVFETGTDRSVAIHKHLLSIVRRAPHAFSTLAAPDGRILNLRGIERLLMDERLDHAETVKPAHHSDTGENIKAKPCDHAASRAGEIARGLGLTPPYTADAIREARRRYAASCHPDRVPAGDRAKATQNLAAINAVLDDILAKVDGAKIVR
jgi:hypothetical protein